MYIICWFAGNWRPIAVLQTLYKLMSRMLLHRLQPMLDAQQSADQFGFRPTCSIRDAFTVLENMCSKTAEFDVPPWLASLDLKKAFDQIECLPLLQAVSEQGVPDYYTNLPAALYADRPLTHSLTSLARKSALAGGGGVYC